MTPAARIAAAAGLLDQILSGASAERTLTNWARGSRYAGSKDRVAVRDLVYDALRRRRSLAWVGRSDSGRGLMLGALRLSGDDPGDLMTGEGHALSPPGPDEAGRDLAEAPDAVRLDLPDWLLPGFEDALGGSLEDVCRVLAARAPATLRVNLRRATREDAQTALSFEGIETVFDKNVRTALQVTVGASKISRSSAYGAGLVELQDASSQAAVLRLPLRNGDRVLDYCAGGGGKTLAMGALADLALFAHDADPKRMTDLPPRAARAGLEIGLLADPTAGKPYHIVLVDAPCSGSGTWRRNPDAKWRLTPARLAELCNLQDRILDAAALLPAPNGHLAYATCSVLNEECEARVAGFMERHPGWSLVDRFKVPPTSDGDGFFQAVFSRN